MSGGRKCFFYPGGTILTTVAPTCQAVNDVSSPCLFIFHIAVLVPLVQGNHITVLPACKCGMPFAR
jgi:hypothetical protein